MSCFDKQGLADAQKPARRSRSTRTSSSSPTPQVVPTAFTFIDDTTALSCSGPPPTTEGVARVAAGNGTLATASSFTATLQNVNTDSAM